MNLKYFSLSEFESPDLPNSGEKMDPQFLSMLDNARDIAGISFKITSGYRSKEHNAKVGGVSNSSHLLGYAADISASSGSERWQIVKALIEAKFTRIGIAKSFIHVDNDPNKNSAIWTY